MLTNATRSTQTLLRSASRQQGFFALLEFSDG
jgi:hypothetical protein